MKTILTLKNSIQEYVWGSHTAIAELLGQPVPSKTPQAELWMGAHPKAPSRVVVNAEWQPLNKLIAEFPIEFLGQPTAAKFGGKLPYLFKVLAAAQPLSVQAHPSLQQAGEGFARENKLEIPLDAPNRNYRDENHKPEILCAVTPFWALCGFRNIDQMVSLFSSIDIAGLETELQDLVAHPGHGGLRRFFDSLMSMGSDQKAAVLAHAAKNARPLADKDPVFRWVLHLSDAYPGDVGVLSPIFLNLVYLKPGQAIFLPAGELHAYLEGTGIELMANSDNVLRGGLTSKHIDVQELINVLTFEERTIPVLAPQRISGTEDVYDSSAEEFVLSRIALDVGRVHSSQETRSIEILLCVDGEVTIVGSADDTSVSLQKGMSVLIQAAAAPYIIKGKGELYKAAVPL